MKEPKQLPGTWDHLALDNELSEFCTPLLQEFTMDLLPQGPIEVALVENIFAADWRIARMQGMETALMNHQIEEARQFPPTADTFGARAALACANSLDRSEILPYLSRMEARYLRNMGYSLRLLMALRNHRRKLSGPGPADTNQPPTATPTNSTPKETPDGNPGTNPGQPKKRSGLNRPKDGTGKARAAANSRTSGLFSTKNLVHPEETEEYERLRTGLLEELQPASIMEQAFAAEILRSLWRLRRCGLTEAALKPTENPETDPAQFAVDRALSQANATLRRSTAELRRLQNERHLRSESDVAQGLTSHEDVLKVRLLKRRLDGLHRFESILRHADAKITNRTQSPAGSQGHP